MSSIVRRDRLDDFFPEFFRRFARPGFPAEDLPGEIRLDVTESDREYLVKAEIPGAKKEDIRVTVDRNFVSITAEVRKEKKETGAGGRVLMQETCSGSASRSFTLPHELDDQRVVARLEDGVLMLTLPKRESAAARPIRIE